MPCPLYAALSPELPLGEDPLFNLLLSPDNWHRSCRCLPSPAPHPNGHRGPLHGPHRHIPPTSPPRQPTQIEPPPSVLAWATDSLLQLVSPPLVDPLSPPFHNWSPLACLLAPPKHSSHSCQTELLKVLNCCHTTFSQPPIALTAPNP